MTKRNKASKDKTKQSILERSAEEVEVKIRARQVYKTVSLCTISMLKSTTVLFYNNVCKLLIVVFINLILYLSTNFIISLR